MKELSFSQLENLSGTDGSDCAIFAAATITAFASPFLGPAGILTGFNAIVTMGVSAGGCDKYLTGGSSMKTAPLSSDSGSGSGSSAQDFVDKVKYGN